MPRTAPSTSSSSVTSSTYSPLIWAYVWHRTANASDGAAHETVSSTGVGPGVGSGVAASEGTLTDGAAVADGSLATPALPPTTRPATKVAAPNRTRTAIITTAGAVGHRREGVTVMEIPVLCERGRAFSRETDRCAQWPLWERGVPRPSSPMTTTRLDRPPHP